MAENRIDVSSRGFKELRETIRAAQRDLADMKPVNTEVSSYVLDRTQAPIGPSGDLSKSGRSSGTKTAAVVRFGTRRVPYAQPIHWGWGRRHIAAHPFLTRAGKKTEPGWIDIYSRRLDEIINQIEGTNP